MTSEATTALFTIGIMAAFFLVMLQLKILAAIAELKRQKHDETRDADDWWR